MKRDDERCSDQYGGSREVSRDASSVSTGEFRGGSGGTGSGRAVGRRGALFHGLDGVHRYVVGDGRGNGDVDGVLFVAGGHGGCMMGGFFVRLGRTVVWKVDSTARWNG